jgi:hypothetical protein
MNYWISSTPDVNTDKTRNLITVKAELSLSTNDLPSVIQGNTVLVLLGPCLPAHQQLQLINSTAHSHSWEATSSLSSQEIPRILHYQKVHFPVHKSPPLVPIPSFWSSGPCESLG